MHTGRDAGTTRWSNPLTWSIAGRALLAVAVVLIGLLAFALNRLLAGTWLYFPTYIDPGLSEALDVLWLSALVGWLALGAGALVLRRTAPESRVLVHLVIQLYSFTIAIFVALAGPFSATGWMFFLAGAIVGFLLFGRAALLGLITFFGLLALSQLLGQLGYLGPLIDGTRPPAVAADEWARLTLRTMLSSALFAGMVLTLCVYIVKLLRDRERRLAELTRTDSLTGVLNRGYFMRRARAELGRARRHRQVLALVMVDLDHFKRINDEHGHQAGDRVLEAVGRALRDTVREHDLVGRYGGEEFVVLLPNTDLDGAMELAERCRAVLEGARVAVDGEVLPVTASFGAAAYDGAGEPSLDQLLRAADMALYRAKQGGRNRVITCAD